MSQPAVAQRAPAWEGTSKASYAEWMNEFLLFCEAAWLHDLPILSNSMVQECWKVHLRMQVKLVNGSR